MADDRHYVRGDYYQLDDITGFKIRAFKSRKIPGGQTGNLIVAPNAWEPQQPQDFVRGVPDVQTVEQPRPRQANQFVVLATNITEGSARGATELNVATPAGFRVGMRLQIMLDTGENFITALSGIDGSIFDIPQPLPASVGLLYGSPPENIVFGLEDDGAGQLFLLGVPAHDILDWNVLA